MARMLSPRQPLRRNMTSVTVTALRGGAAFERPDRLVAEEPLEIRAGGPDQEPAAVAVTMRTPGNDFELAAGFMFTEGLISSREDVASVAYCELPAGEQEFNVVTVRLRVPFDPAAMKRNFFATSSCGVCGKASLEQVRVRCAPVPPGTVAPAATLLALPDLLRAEQRLFDQTGGLHAAALFDAEGDLLALKEDVGRHNATDKLIGWALLDGRLPLSGHAVMVSGRSSFEILQKCLTAGVPIVCAISAPSSLAVDVARRFNITLVGFLRGNRFNVYSAPERVCA